MTPKKILIEITSTLTKTTVLSEDGDVLGTQEWKRIGVGSWRGDRQDWYAILNQQSEDKGDFDELAEALEDLSFTSIAYEFGEINFEEFGEGV